MEIAHLDKKRKFCKKTNLYELKKTPYFKFIFAVNVFN